jgi:hypothetical protein
VSKDLNNESKEEDVIKKTAAIEEMVFDGFKKLSKKRKKEVVDFVSYLKAKVLRSYQKNEKKK